MSSPKRISHVLVAIDPGLRHCGVAVFDPGKKTLEYAGLARSTEARKRGAPAWDAMRDAVVKESWGILHTSLDVVVEVPQVYGGPRQEDPNDLIELAGVDGALIGGMGAVEVRSFKPREWKGQVPKDVHNKRILSKLSPAEKAILDSADVPPSLLHNVVDAVGIGLFALGRMGL